MLCTLLVGITKLELHLLFDLFFIGRQLFSPKFYYLLASFGVGEFLVRAVHFLLHSQGTFRQLHEVVNDLHRRNFAR